MREPIEQARRACLWMIKASPTYETWRSFLVHRLGETSDWCSYSVISTRHEVTANTWCKGDRLLRLLRLHGLAR